MGFKIKSVGAGNLRETVRISIYFIFNFQVLFPFYQISLEFAHISLNPHENFRYFLIGPDGGGGVVDSSKAVFAEK
jgi:hypothetical protein